MKESMSNRKKGSCYEKLAASFFEKQGCVILERNYRRKTGEIDLIVNDHGVLVFTEVKFRRNDRKGYPSEAVTVNKQARIYRTAEWFLNEHPEYSQKPCRFDVISILDEKITHIPNAFGGF